MLETQITLIKTPNTHKFHKRLLFNVVFTFLINWKFTNSPNNDILNFTLVTLPKEPYAMKIEFEKYIQFSGPKLKPLTGWK